MINLDTVLEFFGAYHYCDASYRKKLLHRIEILDKLESSF